ncbi:hypothetical protein ES705_30453 [subsurface metagenome]
MGILAGAFSLEDDPVEVHILNNIVKPPTLEPPNNNNIQVGDGTTGTIIGNEVSGALLESPDWSGSGILVSSSSDVVILYNYVHNSEGGIQITGYAEYQGRPAAEDNIIENNLVEGNECGISVQGNTIGTIIRYNDVLNNDTGIGSLAYDFSYDQSTPSGTQIHYNNIVGNVNYGVESMVWAYDTMLVPAEEVDATLNWWGHASGPADAASYMTSGYEAYGDAVSTYVDYEPWLLAVVVSGVTPTTYDKTLALKDGWTLVSTNKAVADTTSDAGTTSVLKYAVESGALVWATVTVADLEPVDVLCIKTDGGGGVGINYSANQPGVSSKGLLAGWNLISSGTTPIDSQPSAYDILSPLPFAQIGGAQAVGLTTLVSQGSYNQVSGSFYQATLDSTDWTLLKSITLFPYDGYWIQMNAACDFGVITD